MKSDEWDPKSGLEVCWGLIVQPMLVQANEALIVDRRTQARRARRALLHALVAISP